MIAVCVKWVDAPAEPGDDRFAGISEADQAAVELALCQSVGNALHSEPAHEVVVVTAGPPAAERALRDVLACGVHRAVRVDLPSDASGAVVAAELARVVYDAAFVWCGDLSADRGSGSVPAFLAAHLGAAQALGAVHIDLAVDSSGSVDAGRGQDNADQVVTATRRLDGGRRETVRLAAPAVISVEGATARLRRAGLGALIAARAAPIEVRAPVTGAHSPWPTTAHPYRPRARALPPPTGSTLERLRTLTDAAGAPAHGETVHLDPEAAAQRIVAVLREWGYLSD